MTPPRFYRAARDAEGQCIVFQDVEFDSRLGAHRYRRRWLLDPEGRIVPGFFRGPHVLLNWWPITELEELARAPQAIVDWFATEAFGAPAEEPTQAELDFNAPPSREQHPEKCARGVGR